MKDIKCTFEERISTKTNKPYKALFIKLDDSIGYEKIVLLSAPEIALLERNLTSSSKINENTENVFDQFK